MREFASVRDDMWFRQRSAEIAVALALSPALTWIGPFDLVEESFFARMGFWSGVLASWFMLVALTQSLLSRSGMLSGLGSWPRRAVTLALAAIPMIVIVGSAIEALHGWEPSIAEVTELYFQIMVLGAAVLPLSDALVAAVVGLAPTAARGDDGPFLERPAQPLAAQETAPELTCPLLAQIPAASRGRLLCLEMQDHYVRVHTTNGSALVLMRLRDAIADTNPVPGRQVHRSWWVADGAVQRFERAGRTGSLHLSGEQRVPVSARYLQDAAEAFAHAPSMPASPRNTAYP